MLDLIEPLNVTKNRRGDLLHGEGTAVVRYLTQRELSH